MTSKNSFWKYSVWNFKKRAWTFALCATAWFFIMPVALFVESSSLLRNYGMGIEPLQERYNWLRYVVINNHIAGSEVYCVAVLAMGVFLGLQSFAWMHHQNKVDMFKSVPVKGAARFWYINLNSLLIFVLSFGGNLVLANIAASIKGIWSQIFWDASLSSFSMHLMLFLASYFIVIIGQCLTGNTVLGFLGSAVLLGVEPLCFVLREIMMEIFFRTYFDVSLWKTLSSGIISPIPVYVRMYKTVSDGWLGFANGNNYGGIWFFQIIMGAQILLYGTAAYLLYQKRPAQTGGKSIIFPKLKPVVKFVIMTVGSLCAGALMAGFNEGAAMWYGFFGAVCGLFILQVILQTVIEGDFRECIKGKGSFAAAFVVTMFIYFGFALDMAGYDTYLPGEKQIEDFAFARGGDCAYGYVDERGNYIEAERYLLENMRITDEAAIEKLLAVLQREIDAGDYCYRDEEFWGEKTAEAVETTGLRFEDDNRKETLYIKFRLAGGREVVRLYYLKKAAIRECFEEIYELPEYKEAVYPIMAKQTGIKLFNRISLPVVTYTAYNLENKSSKSESYDLVKKLYDTLQEDVAKRSVQVIMGKRPVGILEFAAFPEKYMEKNEYEPDVRQFNLMIPIYEEDEATVALLQEIGWYEGPEVKVEKIAMITVYQTIDDNGNRKEMHLSPGDFLFEQVAEDLVPHDAVSRTPDPGAFTKESYWVEVTLIPEEGHEIYGYQRYSCKLGRDYFPAALEKAFEDIEVEKDSGVG